MIRREKYNTLNGLRTIACIGIVMMHVEKNNTYSIEGLFYQNIIPSFVDFVYLFMMISAFGMCCGYLEQMQNAMITPIRFYTKRYDRILPFYSVLILIDILFNYQSGQTVPEAFADVTLLYGLFPNKIEVVGVGWFLGLVFAFYILFPFYSVLLTNRTIAWISFGLSLGLNYVVGHYFNQGRENIVFSLCFFLAGGLIYLYRDSIAHIPLLIILLLFLVSIFFYFIHYDPVTCLLVSVTILCAAVVISQKPYKKLLDNLFFTFFSNISMEVYLSHMMIFRGIKKLPLNQLLWIENGWIQYIIDVILTLSGAVLFSYLVKGMLNKLDFSKTLRRLKTEFK